MVKRKIEKQIKKKQRSNTFELVINPILEDQKIDWVNLSSDQIALKLKELEFPSKFDLTQVLNSLEFPNIRGNATGIEEFDGQLELGDKTKIPDYQIAIKTKTPFFKKPILEALTNCLNACINIVKKILYLFLKNIQERLRNTNGI
jgi:hypothetical protein